MWTSERLSGVRCRDKRHSGGHIHGVCGDGPRREGAVTPLRHSRSARGAGFTQTLLLTDSCWSTASTAWSPSEKLSS